MINQKLNSSNLSNGNLLDVINNSLTGVTIAIGFPPKIILTNKALERTFGYSESELKNFSYKQLSNLIHPDDRKVFFSRYKARLAGKSVPSRYKVRMFHKNGEICCVELSSHRIIFQGKPAIQTNYLDMTHHYNALEIQKKAFNERDKILNSIDDAIIIFDNNLKIIDANKTYEKLRGIKKKEICGKMASDFFDHIEKSDLGRIHKILELVSKGKKIARQEVTLKYKNKNMSVSFNVNYVKYLVKDTEQIKYIIFSMRDITEEKNVFNQLSDKVSIIESILPSIHSGLLVIANDSSVTLFNKIFLKLWRIPDYLAKEKNDEKLLKFVLDQIAYPKEFLARVRYLYAHPEKSSMDVIELKDGRTYERSSHPQMRNGKIVGRVWNFSDKTALYKEILAREELMKKYEIATNVSGQIFYDYQIPSGEIKWLGPINKVLRYTNAEFQRVNIEKWMELIHPDDRKRAIDVLKQAEKKVGRYECEYRFKVKNDGYIHVLDEGTFFRDKKSTRINMFGSIKNISELVNERAKAESLLAAIGDGVLAIDKHGKITYANEAAQKMFGYPLQRFIGHPCSSICSHHPGIGPNTSKDECPTVQARRLKRKVIRTLKDNYYYTRADGTHFPVYISTSPVYAEGEDAGGILIFRDISAEKDIGTMKSEFVSLASHQLRTPITSINWLTESLLDKTNGELSPTQKEMVENIHVSNRHMTVLVDLLLTVTRLEMGTFPVAPKLINIEDVCSTAMQELEEKIKSKNLKIETACPYGLKKYKADPHIMNMIFQNLLSNAVKYANENTTIKVVGKLVKGELVISFTDHGIGIPKSQQNKIFTKLFRADNAKTVDTGGVGLGLYILKSVIGAVGGRVWFKSRERVGTTFFVALPKKGMISKSQSTYSSK